MTGNGSNSAGAGSGAPGAPPEVVVVSLKFRDMRQLDLKDPVRTGEFLTASLYMLAAIFPTAFAAKLEREPVRDGQLVDQVAEKFILASLEPGEAQLCHPRILAYF